MDLSLDHKPNRDTEFMRITTNNGQVWNQKTNQILLKPSLYQFNDEMGIPDPCLRDIYRVNPGNLNISRSFGDIHLKQNQQKLLIAEPDISEVSIGQDADFIMICCDGIFDCLSTKDTIETAWKQINLFNKNKK